MKRLFYRVVVAALLTVGLAGCGAKEREELQQKVASLEQQLVKANSQLAEKDASVVESRNIAEVVQNKLKEAQATIDAQASKLAKVQVERDKLKQEVAQLKKKKKKRG